MSQSIDSSISEDSIEINMSQEIQDLLEQSLEINKRKGGINAFCVQIYNGQSRSEAQRAKYRFMKMFPEVTSVSYERVSPNWITRAGKFRTKLESERLKNIIRHAFPSAFISQIIINVGEFD